MIPIPVMVKVLGDDRAFADHLLAKFLYKKSPEADFAPGLCTLTIDEAILEQVGQRLLNK